MILSLDTNVMIDIVNGDDVVRGRYDEAAREGAGLVTSAIAAHELVFGAMISRRPQLHAERAEELLADLPIEPWTFEDGVAAARIRRALRSEGRSIGVYDVLIAGQALNRGSTVVSAKLREYPRVEGLSVIDWTRPPQGEVAGASENG